MRRFEIKAKLTDRDEHESILRRQFIVRNEQEFITSFDPEEGDTLHEVVTDLVTYFHLPDGEGYGEVDMVVWRDGRILALVRKGANGEPEAQMFVANPI